MAKKEVMMKRMALVLSAIFLAVCVSSLVLTAEAADPKARLTELKRETARVKYQYEQDVRKLNKECDDNIAVVKEKFHKERNKFLEEKKAKLAALSADYKEKMAPLELEEKELMRAIAPEQANFTRRKNK